MTGTERRGGRKEKKMKGDREKTEGRQNEKLSIKNESGEDKGRQGKCS